MGFNSAFKGLTFSFRQEILRTCFKI